MMEWLDSITTLLRANLTADLMSIMVWCTVAISVVQILASSPISQRFLDRLIHRPGHDD
jgi:hypothetical protein